jgi:predicted RNA-binding Zn ribbon-like protein
MAPEVQDVSGYADKVDLLGGVLCLDFVNTVEPRAASYHTLEFRNYLTRYSDLLDWSLYVGSLDVSGANKLRAKAAEPPHEAQVVLEQAVTLREVMYRVFFTLTQDEEASRNDLDALAAAYAQAMHHARFANAGGRFTLTWEEDPVELSRPLWPVVHSAAELLLNGEKRRVKDCASGAEGCGWLFYDTSKNASRRWCSMRACGTEAKERRRDSRKRGEARQEARRSRSLWSS